jgi:ketosteroid isomerase-like protein
VRSYRPRSKRLQRFIDAGLQLEADEVLAQGPPWNTTLCVGGTSHLDTEDGRVYENRYMMWGRVARGRLRGYEVYEDTQASGKLDELTPRV